MNPRTVAIAGAGNIAGARHLPALRSLGDRVRVVAVADVDHERAEAFAREWEIPAAYGAVAPMLAERRPDLLIVCTPPGGHREGVLAGLDAGAWVWCEKPPTLSLAEYDELAATEPDGGPYLSYVFQHRFGSAAQRLKHQLGSGALGRALVAVCNTVWYRGHEYFDLPWRGRWETEGGGPTMGHGIHQMDLMLWLLGDWQEVRALMGTVDRRVETEDVSMAAVRMRSGALLSVVNSLLSPREESYLRLDCADATVELSHVYGYDNSHWTWTPAPHAAADTARVAGWAPVEDERSGHTAQLRALLDAMDRGERPPAGGADGRRVLEFIAGLYQSAITGRPVDRAELVPGNPFYESMNGRRPSCLTGP